MRSSRSSCSRARDPRAGSALLMVAFLVVGLAGIALSLATLTGSGYVENRESRENLRAFELAESGINEAWATLQEKGEDALVDEFAQPRSFGPDEVDVAVTLGKDDPTIASNRLLIKATATDGTTPVSTQAMVYRVPNGAYRYGIFGDTHVTLESNAYIDSYDSSTGPYDPDAFGGLADVGSNGDIELNANVEVNGGVAPGPGGVVDDSAPQTNVTGVMAPAEETFDIPRLEVPDLPTLPPLNIRGPARLGPGDLHFSRLTVQGGGRLRVQGPATLVLDDLTLASNSSLVLDASTGPITVHCTGDVDLNSNSTLNTIADRARDVIMNVAWDPTDRDHELVLASNADFQGVLIAPESDVVLNSNFVVYGGVMAGSVTMESNARVHFDEDLLYDPGVPIEYAIVSWRRATP